MKTPDLCPWCNLKPPAGRIYHRHCRAAWLHARNRTEAKALGQAIGEEMVRRLEKTAKPVAEDMAAPAS